MLPSIAAIVAGSPEAVLLVDGAGCCHYANPAACRILGYSRDPRRSVFKHDAKRLRDLQP